MEVTVSVGLDTRFFRKKTNDYPITLRVCYGGDSPRYQTNYGSKSQEEFAKLSQRNTPSYLMELKEITRKIQREAEDVITKMSVFTYEGFEKDFLLNNRDFMQAALIKKLTKYRPAEAPFDFSLYHKRIPLLLKEADLKADTIGFTYLKLIKAKLRLGKFKTALSLYCGFVGISNYFGNCRFIDITYEKLELYEYWLLKTREKKLSRSTIGVYTTTLRTVFNRAIKDKVVHKDLYPFGRDKYTIPRSKNPKIALPASDISAIYNHTGKSVSERRYKDYWLFMYLANGMYPVDFSKLKYKAFDQEGCFQFERSKTEWSTKKDPVVIKVYVTDDLQRIIDTWGNKDKSPENYVFPILNASMNPMEAFDAVNRVTHNTNRWMKEIGNEHSLKKQPKTKTARHSYATKLRNSGLEISFIQQQLGHTNPETTELYLDHYSVEKIKLSTTVLTDFKIETLVNAELQGLIREIYNYDGNKLSLIGEALKFIQQYKIYSTAS